MKKAFRKSLKRQSSLGDYFKNSVSSAAPVKNDTPNGTAILWQALARKYQFNYPKDWYNIEAHWLDQIESFQEQPIDCPGRDGQMNNAITRISQCNESYQLCNSLPRSFIVPKDLKDVILIDTLSTIIKNHRVPVVTYCCPIEYRRNFIIRCASASSEHHHDKVIDTIARAVKPSEVLDLNYLAPSWEKIDKSHKKLHNACRRSDDNTDNLSSTNANFLSRSGKWLCRVSQTLKLANQAARTLLTQASVILIDEDDRGWNCVISSLVQLIIEPHRRTIEGFESLLSKEWIYLTGCQSIIDQPQNYPAQYQQLNILFELFLDCTYQIYLQNPREFEFSSDYLSYLHSLQHNTCIKSTVAPMQNSESVQSYHKESLTGMNKHQAEGLTHSIYKPANRLNKVFCSIDAMRIFDNGKLTMLNHGYTPDKDSPILKIYDHVANMKLWASQYIDVVDDDGLKNHNNNNNDDDNDDDNNIQT